MDIDGINFYSFTNYPSRGSDAVNEENMPAVEDDWNCLFINYAAIAWHEMRRAWRGDQSAASQRKPREPIIRYTQNDSWLDIWLHSAFCNMSLWKMFSCSWNISKSELLSSEEPFDGPVPLSKIVEFLVEVWEEDPQD